MSDDPFKLLYASERPPYPFFLGGAARSAHYLLSTLVQDFGVDAAAAGSREYGGQLWEYGDIQNPQELRVAGAEDDGATLTVQCGYPVQIFGDFYSRLLEVIERDQPDVIWTQLDGFERIAVAARSLDRNTIVFLRDADDPPEAIRKVAALGCGLVCNSEFMAHRIASLTGRRAGVVYPSLEADFGVRGAADGFITMINPHQAKGIDTFLAVARAMPELAFLLVESWKLGSQALAALHRRLADLPNVTFMHRVADVSEVYAQTRLLLVPSVCEEAFGRVVIEAQSCGIPVIASRRGGLPEAVGDGGACIDRVTDPAAWVKAVEGLLASEVRYRELSARAVSHATSEQFSARHAASRLMEIFRDPRTFGGSSRTGLASWFTRRIRHAKWRG